MRIWFNTSDLTQCSGLITRIASDLGWARQKYPCTVRSIISLQHRFINFILFFYPRPTQSSPKQWYCASTTPPPQSNLFSFISFVVPVCFWLVVACKILCGGRLRPRSVYFLFFFVAHFDCPNDRIVSHPILIARHAIAPTSNPSLPPSFSWLLCLSFE